MDTCREILDSMVKKGNAEWVSGSGRDAADKNLSAIIFWRRPEEWANMIADWVSLFRCLDSVCEKPGSFEKTIANLFGRYLFYLYED